jgi:hypothetical protein
LSSCALNLARRNRKDDPASSEPFSTSQIQRTWFGALHAALSAHFHAQGLRFARQAHD